MPQYNEAWSADMITPSFLSTTASNGSDDLFMNVLLHKSDVIIKSYEAEITWMTKKAHGL